MPGAKGSEESRKIMEGPDYSVGIVIRIIASRDVHILISGTRECVTYMAKGIRSLINRWAMIRGEMERDYPLDHGFSFNSLI